MHEVFLGVWAGGRNKAWMASEVLEAENVLGQMNRSVWILKGFCKGPVGRQIQEGRLVQGWERSN